MIKRNDNILNITHNDLDGCGCNIVLRNVFKNVTHIFSSFYNIDEKLQNLDYNLYDYVILTDIHPENIETINISDKIILFDHHPSEFNDHKKLRFVVNNKSYCATVMVKYFFEKLYSIDLSHLNPFVKYVNDYDTWQLKYDESKHLNNLMFYKYKPDGFVSAFIDGRINFTSDELKFLTELNERFNRCYDELIVNDFKTINACIVFESDFINEIADKLLKDYKYDLVIIKHPSKGRCSFRTNNTNINIGDILTKYEWGGGHPESAGMFVKTISEFEEKMNILENYLYNNYNIRKVK